MMAKEQPGDTSQSRTDQDIFEFITLNSFKRKFQLKPKKALFEFQTHLIGFAAYAPFVDYFNSMGLKSKFIRIDEPLSLMRSILLKLKSLLLVDNLPSRPYFMFRSMKFARSMVVHRKSSYSPLIKKRAMTLLGGTKKDILQLRLEGIHVGDLFYDWHLRKREIPTIDSSSLEFIEDLTEFMRLASIWDRYIRRNKFEYVVVTHAVYLQGLLLRLAIKNNAQVFLVTSEKVFHFNSQMVLADLEPLFYKTALERTLNYQIDLSRASAQLENLMTGSTKTDVAHSYVNGMNGQERTRVIAGASDIRILIAAHCFSDSPHTNGLHIFADFMEWLEWLAGFSETTNYEWYVKQHPAFFPSDYVVLDEFCQRNPNIRLVNSKYSNAELVKQGINVVLTVYGTIAFEMAYLGVVVVNASTFAPHSNFDFSLSPSSVEEYRGVLSDLPELVRSTTPDRNEVLHFYDIHHLRRNHNWLFDLGYSEMTNDLKIDYSSPLEIFEFYLKRMQVDENLYLLNSRVKTFINSDSYLLA